MMTTIAERIKEIRKRLGLSQSEMTEKLHLGHQTVISSYERGLTQPTLENALKIAKLGGVSVEWLISGEVEILQIREEVKLNTDHLTAHEKQLVEDFVLVPLYDVKAAAGHGCANYSENIEKQLAFRRDFLLEHLHSSPKDLFLLRVHGDSMEPSIKNNDIVLCDKNRKKCKQDGVYIVRIDGDLFVKNMQTLPDKLRIYSVNPNYPAFEVYPETKNFEVVAQVIWVARNVAG